MGERRKQLTPELTQAFLEDLERLPVDVDVPANSGNRLQGNPGVVPQARLTAYDAAYLELAMRENQALATVDEDLRRAAIAENVPTL